ncbi:hypothetical protein HZA75_03805 [Candidatus Roizmanbacteria bacterium]|nr:hypothetical protein [Candidatus Roizmanbacteria bacterium]
MVIGLENSGTTAPLEIYYAKIIKKARELTDKHQVRIVLARDYAKEFIEAGKSFADSDTKFYLTKDYKSDDQSFWYNSPNFRAGILKTGNDIYLVDLRDYTTKKDEDFLLLSNSQGYLRISEPAVIDSIRFPESKLLLAKNANTMKISKKGDEVDVFNGNTKIAKFTISSLVLYPDKGETKTFLFTKKFLSGDVFYIFLSIYILYGLIIYLHKKNLLNAFLQVVLLLIPLFIAYPYLTSGFSNTDFIFDRKELLLFYISPMLNFLSVSNIIILIKTIPFIFLLTSHYLLTVINSKLNYKIAYYLIFSLIVVFYAHVDYFPLDKSTYIVVFSIFVLIFLVLSALSIFIWLKTKNKKILIGSLAAIPFFLVILFGIIYISRTKVILTQFEMDALKVVRRQHKNVLFVSENDYNIKPIYKAVKLMLYENYHLGEKLTNTRWQIVKRPDNNVIQLKDYRNKLIVVPRYLGANLSEHEMEINDLKKIFDNAQIAIFEKK